MVQVNSIFYSKLAALCFALVLDLDLQYWNFTVGRYVKFAIQLVTSYNSPLLRVISDQVYSARQDADFLADATQMAKNGHIYTPDITITTA